MGKESPRQEAGQEGPGQEEDRQEEAGRQEARQEGHQEEGHEEEGRPEEEGYQEEGHQEEEIDASSAKRLPTSCQSSGPGRGDGCCCAGVTTRKEVHLRDGGRVSAYETPS